MLYFLGKLAVFTRVRINSKPLERTIVLWSHEETTKETKSCSAVLGSEGKTSSKVTSSLADITKIQCDYYEQADRDGRADEFADMYEESTLKQANDQLFSGGVGGPKKTRLSMMTSLELSVKQETTTPFWFALKTLIKVDSIYTTKIF
jgi:hypothetical protein